MRTIPIILSLIAVLSGKAQEHFEDWQLHNAGEKINSEFNDYFPMIMPDGLTLYFSSDRPGGLGDLDIYFSTRNSVDDPWGEPVNLGPNINSPKSDHSVTILYDGTTMIYTSEKEGSIGTADLYISNNNDPHNPVGWEKSKNAGSTVNVESAWTACPLYVQDNEKDKIFFTSNRSGEGDVFVSLFTNGQFQEPTKLGGIINTQEGEMHFDPVEGFIWTNREGGLGQDDIWIAVNRKNEIEWKDATNLGALINSEFNEGMPSMTHDKSLFVFHSDRPSGNGKYDIYFATKK